MAMRGATLLLALLLAFGANVSAFKAHEFRYCQDSSFCRRHRKFDGTKPEATFHLDTLQLGEGGSFVGKLTNQMDADRPLSLTVTALADGMIRVHINEEGALHKRYEVQDVLVGDTATKPLSPKPTLIIEGGVATVTAGDRTIAVHLAPSPFRAVVSLKGVPVVALNSRNLMKWEVYKDKGAPGALEDVTGDNDGLWEESFGAHRDSRPKGPSSVGMDVTWLDFKHVYGLSERASSFALGNSKGPGAARDEPYRLYNLDVFEYDVTPDRAHQPLYGAVPLMLSHSAAHSAGLLWLNAAETMIDVEDAPNGKNTHWFSESGVIDIFIMAAETPAEVQGQFALLVGTQFMPPLFSLGYHQCRWNYKDEQDVKSVDAKFDEHDIPYDVIWLDIEHTVGKRYMTWDRHLFPDPEGMQEDLASRGRKTVTIVDPHLKADQGYPVYAEAKKLGYFVRTADGGDFEGHCWPGGSSWLDYLSPQVRDYWASRFKTENYVGSTSNLYTWNDMNEPSVFNGPEITMQKDLKHAGNVEHRDVHNQYGFYMTMATYAGHNVLRPDRRPFILSRAFFAGSQRYVAVWTGDNMAKWEHLAAATPMLLQLSMTGIQFCGADVGGFFYNPEAELMVRWYQAAAYTPFFRGHAHIDTARREPWLFGEEAMGRIRSAIRSRYTIMPYLYTQFHRAHTLGTPIMRPLWFDFPADESTYAMDDAWMLGPALLVKPVTKSGATSTNIYLPTGAPGSPPVKWYPFKGSNAGKAGLFKKLWGHLQGTGGSQHAGGSTVNAESTLDSGAPVFQRGGTIVPTRERARRSTAAMKEDPFTLHVALSGGGEAEGELYLDDGDSTMHSKGQYAKFRIVYNQNSELSCSRSGGVGDSPAQTIERVVVYGLSKEPKSVDAQQTGSKMPLEFTYDKGAQVLLVRKPNVSLKDEWKLTIA